MNLKYWFDLGYAVLVIIALIILGWSSTHRVQSSKLEAKSKIFADIKAVAGAFVHYYDTTEMAGSKKMAGVIDSTTKALSDRGYKIDPDVKALVEAFAQQYFDEHLKKATVKTAGDKTIEGFGTAKPVENADDVKVTVPDDVQ